MVHLTHLPEWSLELDRIAEALAGLQSEPTTGGPALGVPDFDNRLYRIGRECVAALGLLNGTPASAAEFSGPRDIYLASTLYQDGGHTPLIGDFVRALGVERSQVILTGQPPDPDGGLSPRILARIGLSADQVLILNASTRGERLQQLLAELDRIRPDRLFLFHHPDDPLACVVAQPELARQRVLVHHADATTTLGLHLPGVAIIDLNPQALAPTALSGLESRLLPLTAPDPGPRRVPFFSRGRLHTASCGNEHKFMARYAFGYPETVARVLRVTEGEHTHIGPLSEPALASILQALDLYAVPHGRFRHIPLAPSVPLALWELGCDVFLASFPVDGARTRVEVLASGTPFVRHTRNPPGSRAEPWIDDDGLWVWRDWEGLEAALRRLSSLEELEGLAAQARRLFELTHHPAVFRARLEGILDGSVGASVVSSEQLLRAIQRILRFRAAPLQKGST